MRFPPDPGLLAVLTTLGVQPGDLLGYGGEAWVYALADERVVRVLHDGANQEAITASAALTDRLFQSRPPFQLPRLIDVGEVDGRWYAIERRLPGRSVLEELPRVEDRTALVEAYLEASARLGDLALDGEHWWGDLLRVPPVRADTWREYLWRKAEASLRAAGPDFAALDAESIADDLPAPTTRSFVHLDAFPGNMLTDGSGITAIIDFGATVIAGDRRLDPLASAVYLTPEITPTADERDRRVAEAWLRGQGLVEMLVPVQRWLAAYWSVAVDDLRLHSWCRSVLLG